MTPCERTKFLIAWWDRLAPIVNGEMQANRDLCQDLAQFCGELGNDDPSEYAIGVAQEWERMIQRGEKPWLVEVRETMPTSLLEPQQILFEVLRVWAHESHGTAEPQSCPRCSALRVSWEKYTSWKETKDKQTLSGDLRC